MIAQQKKHTSFEHLSNVLQVSIFLGGGLQTHLKGLVLTTHHQHELRFLLWKNSEIKTLVTSTPLFYFHSLWCVLTFKRVMFIHSDDHNFTQQSQFWTSCMLHLTCHFLKKPVPPLSLWSFSSSTFTNMYTLILFIDLRSHFADCQISEVDKYYLTAFHYNKQSISQTGLQWQVSVKTEEHFT